MQHTLFRFSIFCAVLLVVSCSTVRGQLHPTGFFDNTGQPMFTFSTYDECIAGKTRADALHVQFGGAQNGENHPSGFKLTVIANTDFSNGGFSIPANKVSLKLNSFTTPPALTGVEVMLNTGTEQLITQTSDPITTPPTSYMAIGYDVKVYGGNWLLVPAGIYSASFTIKMYDGQTNSLMGTLSNIQLQIRISYDNSCGGVALGAFFTNGPDISSYDLVPVGVTAQDAINLQYTPNGSTCRGWSLKVHTVGNFMNVDNNPNHYIPTSNVSIAFDKVVSGSPSAAAIGINSAAIPLSTADVTVISNAQAGFDGYTAHAFNMILQGGNYLLAIGAGTYNTQLVFSIYNQAGNLVSTYSVPVSIILSFSNPNSATITLNDPDVFFQFSSLTDYANGKTMTKSNGLEVLAYVPYHINAEVTYANFTSGSNALAPSVVNLKVVPNHTYASNFTPPNINPPPSGIEGYNIDLEYSWQKVIDNPMPADNFYPYQDAFYDLIYSIKGGNSDLYTAPAGTYTNQVIFQLVPY